MGVCLLASAILLALLSGSRVHCEESLIASEGSAGDGADPASIPILASGKRQHNIMRFGKRPAGGHSLIHFGKREEEGTTPQKGHSFLYFGKRDGADSSVADLLDYFQSKSRDGSFKRGHSIMRFGKRDPGTHSFIRFGRGDDQDEGKRGGGHSMLYFGKRFDAEGDDQQEEEKREGHSMLYFGKRGTAQGHSMMYFGKREDDDYDDNSSEDVEKRAHSMIHFGKRETGNDGPRRGSHSMIHFGKRDPEVDGSYFYWTPEAYEAKRQHNLLRFGKKDRKGSHAMIHFGKRDPGGDKRAHSMIHFGKRSIDEDVLGNKSENGPLSRVKRQIDPSLVVPEVSYEASSEEEGPMVDELEQTDLPKYIDSNEFLNYYWGPQDNWDPRIDLPGKKSGAKNSFLRFG